MFPELDFVEGERTGYSRKQNLTVSFCISVDRFLILRASFLMGKSSLA